MTTIRLTALVTAAMLTCPTALVAWTLPPPPVVLSAPTAISPAYGPYAYDYAAPNLSFVWEQYPAVSTRARPLPTHYLFCMEPAGVPCTQANALADVLPGQLPSVPLRDSNNQLIGYRYTFTPTIPDNRLDALFDWSVVGCDASACEASKATQIVAATAELVAINLSGNVVPVLDEKGQVVGSEYRVAAEARNVGSRRSGPFSTRIVAWEALGDEITGCYTDPNEVVIADPSLAYLIDNRGVLTQLAQVPRDSAGHYVVTGTVVGIIYGSAPVEFNSAAPSGLRPSRSTRENVGILEGIPAPARTRPIASAMYLDVDGQVHEADESNNSLVECELVYGT
jgi:hypothetical protein